MRLCVNWLPLTLDLTRQVAERAEEIGVWGLGIGDSPHYSELYAACATALGATSSLHVTTSVTNPVTRHWSVHAVAARTFGDEFPGRFRLAMGRGDSAVHTHGLRPATLRDLETALHTISEHAPDAFTMVAASGPATSRMAGRVADGVIAGVGADPQALAMIRDTIAGARPPGREPAETWASVRLAIGRTPAEVEVLRQRLTPRAISASHFAFASTFEGKNVPEEYHDLLTERYSSYDYSSHGRSGPTSNATMFADRPDIERYLLDRFAVVGLPEDCRDRLEQISEHVDGIYVSIVFEEALDQLARVGDMLNNVPHP